VASSPLHLPRGARSTAIEAARAAGAIQLRNLGSVQQIRYKGEIDLVTEVDLQAERAIVDLIRLRFPRHRVLAEEGSVGGDDPEFRWIVDPLDGTTNYSHGFPFFCVSIGLEVGNRIGLGVIYDPVRDELFEAQVGKGARLNGLPIKVSGATELARALLATGFPYDRALFPLAMLQFRTVSLRCQAVRRVGSAALDLCYVANGRFDAYWEQTISPWDVAAGSLIVSEAGGVMSDLAGEPFNVHGASVVASAPGIHSQLLAVLHGVASAD
jgi:myo-inositol-1(or 4)-monophosphatase